MAEKRGLLAVSFGTTCDEARREAIEAIENDWKEAFPDMELKRAFTSDIVRRKLAERGIYVQSVEEALEAFRQEGCSHIWIQPTHLIPGEEYDRLKAQAKRWENSFSMLKVGEPLLLSEEDYDNTVRIMKGLYGTAEDTACIFMGHGTYHEANRAYEKIEKRLEKESVQRYYMATVEGTPSLEDILARLDKEGRARRITLAPFMLVAGEHARSDMAGEEETSWKNICGAHGYEADCVLHGMGFYPEIRALYLGKCRKALGGTFYGISVGPGAGGNLTLDAAGCIRKCDVLAAPRTGGARLDETTAGGAGTDGTHTVALDIVRKADRLLEEMSGRKNYLGLPEKEILYLDFLMTRDTEKRNQVYEELAGKIVEYLRDGKNVGMIVLGDVGIYATVSYLTAPIRRAGYEVSLLPGVSSFCAAAAAAGRSLTTMSRPLHIIPAGYDGLIESLGLPGSKVLMKAGKSLPETKRALKEMGMYEGASMVKDCGMETQEICWDLDEDTERSSYFTTILVPDIKTAVEKEKGCM